MHAVLCAVASSVATHCKRPPVPRPGDLPAPLFPRLGRSCLASIPAFLFAFSLARAHTHGSFDWFVPVEIEPGKYMFRISPVSHLGPENVNHRFSEKEQVSRFFRSPSPTAPLHSAFHYTCAYSLAVCMADFAVQRQCICDNFVTRTTQGRRLLY